MTGWPETKGFFQSTQGNTRPEVKTRQAFEKIVDPGRTDMLALINRLAWPTALAAAIDRAKQS
jgi:hypothetical protein